MLERNGKGSLVAERADGISLTVPLYEKDKRKRESQWSDKTIVREQTRVQFGVCFKIAIAMTKLRRLNYGGESRDMSA